MYTAVDDNKLRIGPNQDDAVWVTFATQVLDVVEYDDFAVVLLHRPVGGRRDNRNVFAIRLDGSQLWQIPEPAGVRPDSPFMSVYKENGRLFAYNYGGTEAELEPATGRVLKVVLVR